MDWSVYLVHNCSIVHKTKFLVVFEVDGEFLGFLINSKHHKILQRSYNKSCVAKISAVSNSFLDHDSFIDCTKMIPLEMNHLYLKKGEVCEDTKYNVIKAVVACPVLEIKLKNYLTKAHSTYLPS